MKQQGLVYTHDKVCFKEDIKKMAQALLFSLASGKKAQAHYPAGSGQWQEIEIVERKR